MKTIEEKAKAYDEAFERAKQIRNGNPSSGTAIVVCEQIFPELAESEDERIIEEIKFAVMQMPTERQDTKERCIAWLEKQKEQKPVDEQFEEWLNAWYQGSKELGGDVVMSEEEFKNWSRGIKNMYDKPVEWSEEDETKLNDVIRIIENHCGLVESIRNHYVKFLKRLRPSWKPSEEQMMWLKCAVDATQGEAHEPLLSLYYKLLDLKRS